MSDVRAVVSRPPGRPPVDSCRIRFSLLNSTRVLLERLAREKGYGAGDHLEIGRVIDEVVAAATAAGLIAQPEEPAYVKLAREAQSGRC